MKSHATIYHIGGWGNNHGDRCIQYAFRQHLDRMAGGRLRWRYINYQERVLDDALVTEMNAHADVVVVGPGGAVMNRDGTFFQLRSEPGAWNKLEVPVVFQSIGLNKFPYEKWPRFWAKDMAQYMPMDGKRITWTWRNHGSARCFMLYGKPLPVVADAALFIEPDDIDIRKPGKLNVGVCWAGDRWDKRWPDTETEANFLLAVTRECRRLVKERNAVIWAIPHHPTDLELPEWECIRKTMPLIYPPQYDGTPEFAGVYRNMDLVLGMRKHSVIVPYGQYTKTIALGDQDEVRWFLEDMGESQYLYTSRNLWSLPHLVDRILADEDWVDRVTYRKQQMKADFWGSLHHILELAGIAEPDYRHARA